jgi:uncharacterized protein YbcI
MADVGDALQGERDGDETGFGAEPTRGLGQALLEVSNAIVRLHKHYYGKGPTKARCFLDHDAVVVVLEDGFTRAEEVLIAHGEIDQVRHGRHAIQQHIKRDLREAVEQIVGRRVRSVMSSLDPDECLQTEIFILYPTGADGLGTITQRAAAARKAREDLREQHRALLAEQQQAAAQLLRTWERGESARNPDP